MRTPAPMVVSHGPCAGPPATPAPYPPDCRTAQALRCGGVVGVVGGDGWGVLGLRGSRCRCGCADGDPDGGGKDGAEDEGVGGEDAVVDDVLDVGVGAQGGDGGGFVVGVGGGCRGRDAEGSCCCATMRAPLRRAWASASVLGPCRSVGDEITVRNGNADGAGKLLGARVQSRG